MKTLWEIVNKDTGRHKKHMTRDIFNNNFVNHSIISNIETSSKPSLNNHRFATRIRSSSFSNRSEQVI